MVNPLVRTRSLRNRGCADTHTQRSPLPKQADVQIWDRQTHQINIRLWLSALPSRTILPHFHLCNHQPFPHSSLFNHLLLTPSHYPSLSHTSLVTITTHFCQIHREYLSIHFYITDNPMIFSFCCLLVVLGSHIHSPHCVF